MADVKGIGRRLSFGIGRETTRGTVVAAGFWIPWNELDINEKQDKVLEEMSIGVIEDSIGSQIAKVYSEGSWKAPVGDKHFPLVLYSLLGALSSSGVSDSAYTHTITVAQTSQHQSLTLGLDDPLGQQDYQHALSVVTGVDINYEVGKFVEYTARFMGKKGTTATLSPSITSENRFLHKHLTFKLATDLSGLGAASALTIKSLSLKIDQNTESDDVLGNQAPNDYLNKQFSVEGTFEALWADEATYKTAFTAGTAKAMRIALNSDTLIGVSSVPQLQIDLAKVIFTELTRPVRTNDMVRQTLAFKASYSSGDSKLITIQAINATVSY